ncbi:hypothetical protein [Escherichia albertii]
MARLYIVKYMSSFFYARFR